MALALDGPNDDDSVFDVNDFSFCINKELLGTIEGVKLDLTYMGFVINPIKPLPSSGSECGSCGSGGTCGH